MRTSIRRISSQLRYHRRALAYQLRRLMDTRVHQNGANIPHPLSVITANPLGMLAISLEAAQGKKKLEPRRWLIRGEKASRPGSWVGRFRGALQGEKTPDGSLPLSTLIIARCQARGM